MKSSGLLLLLLCLVFFRFGQAQVKPFLVDCGSNSSINVDGRKWVGDSVPADNFTMSSPGVTASTATISGEDLYGNLYKTARIFNTSSSYNFSLVSGSYYIRLHFYPFSFENFNVNESAFDVMANSLKLVSKFRVPGEIYWKNMRSNSNITSLVKEYFFDISSNKLQIEFIPDSGSFAFVNAMEVIPVLDELFTDSVNKVGGSKSSLALMDQGIETMYRLNVGGPDIKPSEDQTLWRDGTRIGISSLGCINFLIL